jgi:hypothetical protein
MTAYRREADATQAATEAETCRRLSEARRDQRERELRRAALEADIDGCVAAAIERERQPLLDALSDALGSAVGELLASKLGPITEKLSELERALNRSRRDPK